MTVTNRDHRTLPPRPDVYKKPSSVALSGRLAKNAYGKILKRELREPYWQGHTRRV